MDDAGVEFRVFRGSLPATLEGIPVPDDYQGAAESRHLPSGSVEIILGIVETATEYDGVAPLSELAVLAVHEDDPEVIHVIVLRSGVVSGYANVRREDSPVVELVISPKHRGQGLGSQLLSYAASLAQQESQEHCLEATVVWSHGDLPAARALAATALATPLKRERELLQLRRSTARNADPHAPALSASISVLSLEEADRRWGRATVDQELLRVNNTAFSWHSEQGGWNLGDIEGLRARSWFDPEGVFLAVRSWDQKAAQRDSALEGKTQEDSAPLDSAPLDSAPLESAPLDSTHQDSNGQDSKQQDSTLEKLEGKEPVGKEAVRDAPEVLGFHWTKVHPASDGHDVMGEVFIVGVEPQAQGQGIGGLLTAVGVKYLVNLGVSTVLLYVEAENSAALATYERLGFRRFQIDVAYRLPKV